jgi:phage tail sheath protein FI
MPTYLTPGVYVEEVSSGSRPIEGVGTAVAAFVGFTETGPISTPTLVVNWSQYTAVFGGFVEDAYLPHSVYGYFLNGGGAAYIVRLPDDRGGDDEPSFSRAALPAADGKPGLTVRALAAGPAGNELTVRVAEAGGGAEDTFKLEVLRGGKVEESFDNLSTKRGAANVVTVLARQSKLVAVEETAAGGLAVPDRGANVALGGGTLPARRELGAEHYIGDTTERTGFSGLEAVDEITMLAVPDLMAAYQRGLLDMTSVRAVQLAMIAHCELMSDRVALLDPPPGLNAQQVRDWRVDTAGYDSKYATLYWPWLETVDPQSGARAVVPPSGHVGGVWARTDATRGVHKAPANEVLRGVVSPAASITRTEQEILNPIGVNCIRAFPAQGIRVWGARTLSSDAEWRYLNVRRLFNYVEKSILEGTNWVVFEPNDQYLWESVRRVISAFLDRVWRSGALVGRTPGQSYFVKCDAENNPPEGRDAGNLVVEVGIAPVKPAEFIVFRISQFAEGAALDE